MTPAPLLAAERIALLIAEDRVKRAAILGVLFLVFGVAGIGMNLGGRADGWYPFLGVPFVMAGAVAFVWWRTRCPRCGRRVLMGRRRLPGVCPACGARLVAAKAPRDASDDVSTG